MIETNYLTTLSLWVGSRKRVERRGRPPQVARCEGQIGNAAACKL